MKRNIHNCQPFGQILGEIYLTHQTEAYVSFVSLEWFFQDGARDRKTYVFYFLHVSNLSFPTCQMCHKRFERVLNWGRLEFQPTSHSYVRKKAETKAKKRDLKHFLRKVTVLVTVTTLKGSLKRAPAAKCVKFM